MKKRKLKKKIKKLKSDIKWMKGCQHNLALRESNNANHIKNLSDAYTNKFNKFNPMVLQNNIDDLNHRMDSISMDVKYLISSIERINGRCDILDRRTQTDYDKIIPKTYDVTEAEKNGEVSNLGDASRAIIKAFETLKEQSNDKKGEDNGN